MTFYLEDYTPTVSHVDDAGVLSGALDDALSLLWEQAEEAARRFIAAVL
jgi:hypothetical protein